MHALDSVPHVNHRSYRLRSLYDLCINGVGDLSRQHRVCDCASNLVWLLESLGKVYKLIIAWAVWGAMQSALSH